MATLFLNGTSFTPNSIDEEREKIGTLITAANGATRFAHRAIKRQYKLTWTNVTAAVRNQLRTIYALTTTFTMLDEDGTSITVLCPPGGFTASVTAITVESGVTTLRYTVTLTVREA